jgi:hypothetical protein
LVHALIELHLEIDAGGSRDPAPRPESARMAVWKRLLREPLLHFVALGVVVTERRAAW